jgi:hypothetical protein
MDISRSDIWPRDPIIYVDSLCSDIDMLPPLITGNRPDVLARDMISNYAIVGEAKTAEDIDNQHTLDQIASFIAFIGQCDKGELWLAVPWLNAGIGVRLCRRARSLVECEHVPFKVIEYMVGNTVFRRDWYG